MSIEEDLRSGLRRRAASIEVTGSWDQVAFRAGRGGGLRWPVLAVGMAVVAMLGSTGGFIAGRSSAGSPNPSTLATGSAARNSAARALHPSSSGATGLAPAHQGAGSSSSAAPFSANLALGHLFNRTTPQGITVRAYTASRPGPISCGALTPCPMAGPLTASSCPATTTVVAELSNPNAVGEGFATGVPGGTGAVSVLGHGVLGVSEGSPFSWVSASAGPGVYMVKASFAGLAIDEMAPVNGFAVLAVPGAVSEPSGKSGTSPPPEGQVQGLDSKGKVISTVAFGAYTAAAACPSSSRTTRG